jgi:dihydrofolate synthase/folylpolyglutamate synthase
MAVFANKDLAGILERVAPLAAVGYAATTDSVRARPAEEISAAMAAEGIAAETFPSVEEAFAVARASAGPDDLILVTGSLYTVADARRALFREVS